MHISTRTQTSTSVLQAADRVAELSAIVAIIRSGAISPIHSLSTLLDQVGSAAALLELNAASWSSLGGTSQQQLLRPVTKDDLDRASADVEAWLADGLDVRSVLDASYPVDLRTIFNRPPLLFIAGTWNSEKDSRSVAIVGTRKPSVEGERRAQRLARELVAAGYTILSGLAAGIDTAAHTAALDAGGRTVAVMGTGIRKRYPTANRALADKILASGGALMSQFFPDQPPTKWTFPMRNVVMSGLSLATVVIEAAETSGARMQARIALEHGRAVFVPSSLVHAHEWARRYTVEGVYGTRAIEVSSAEEVAKRLDGVSMSDSLATA